MVSEMLKKFIIARARQLLDAYCNGRGPSWPMPVLDAIWKLSQADGDFVVTRRVYLGDEPDEIEWVS